MQNKITTTISCNNNLDYLKLAIQSVRKNCYYKDMPFILAPNLWSKLSFNKKNIDLVERAHGDGIRVSVESPEAFEEVFWMTFDEYDIDTKEKFKNRAK